MIFLSYATEQRPLAERIALALRAQDEEVFFDKDDIDEGSPVSQQIRDAIRRADLILFLISPESIKRGRYPRAELAVAVKMNPRRLLPVLASPMSRHDFPGEIKDLDYVENTFDAQGDIVVEVCASVRARTRRIKQFRWLRKGAAALVAAALIGLAVYVISSTRVYEVRATSPDFAIRGVGAGALWGGTVQLSLQDQRPGAVPGFRCQVDWDRQGNITEIVADEQCENIDVALVDRPFMPLGAGLAPQPLSTLAWARPIIETVSIAVVDRAGSEVWRQDARINLSNAIAATAMQLDGIPRTIDGAYSVTLGTAYETEPQRDGSTLSDEFRCTVAEPPAREFVIVRAEVVASPCRLRLTPTVQRSTASLFPARASIRLTISHPDTGYSIPLTLDFEVQR